MTKQTKRSARIATLCVLGAPVRTTHENTTRIRLLTSAVDAIIDRNWKDLDALLLPGGYFWLPRAIGDLNGAGQRAAIMRQAFAKAACQQVRRLQQRSPGCLLVLGVRASAATKGEYLEQVCIAFSGHQIAGLARKIFPTTSETSGRLRTTPRVKDYGSPLRIVLLPSGHSALLAACYDMFGVCERPGSHTKRYWAIRVLKQQNRVVELSEPGFCQLRAECLSHWEQLLKRARPRIALAAIHAFERPGRDGFWQRHGIAAASSALRGGLAIGAAHFYEGLPKISSSTLAAADVPLGHLRAGLHRKARRLQSSDSSVVVLTNKVVGLIRLFIHPRR